MHLLQVFCRGFGYFIGTNSILKSQCNGSLFSVVSTTVKTYSLTAHHLPPLVGSDCWPLNTASQQLPFPLCSKPINSPSVTSSIWYSPLQYITQTEKTKHKWGPEHDFAYPLLRSVCVCVCGLMINDFFVARYCCLFSRLEPLSDSVSSFLTGFLIVSLPSIQSNIPHSKFPKKLLKDEAVNGIGWSIDRGQLMQSAPSESSGGSSCGQTASGIPPVDWCHSTPSAVWHPAVFELMLWHLLSSELIWHLLTSNIHFLTTVVPSEAKEVYVEL